MRPSRTPELQHLPGAVMGLAHESFSPGAKSAREAQHAPVNLAGQRVRHPSPTNGGTLAVFAASRHSSTPRAIKSASRASSSSSFRHAHSSSFVMAASLFFCPAAVIPNGSQL